VVSQVPRDLDRDLVCPVRHHLPQAQSFAARAAPDVILMVTLPNPFLDSVVPSRSADEAAAALNPPPAPDVVAARFVLDVDRFMEALKPLPLFLQFEKIS
jgi:hypothetical protein